ncbi:MAG: FRG domain-containing protein [Bacteroidales bacterium]|nr:FRG domain-containing protein [Bacteroidales bacterium]
MNKYLKKKESNKPKLYRISRIEEFIELVTWMSTDGQIVFRGQRQDLPLIPKVGRDIENKRWFSSEIEIFKEFKREAIQYLKFSPENNWQWLAVAQHNGLPTRLLDWTRNPLVALWFTVSKPANKSKPGIVWSLIYNPKEAIVSTAKLSKTLENPFMIENTFLYFPEHIFPYIQAQSGVFTIQHRKDTTTRFVPLESNEKFISSLLKIEIPAKSFSTLRYQLFRLGVTPSSLFPGLSGLVDRIKYQNELLIDEFTAENK